MDSIKLLVLEELWRKEPHSKVFLRLAEELRKSGQYERAISVCKAGLPNHPGYVPALVSLGRSSRALGNYQEAENVFSQVLELSPDNTHALRGLGQVLADRGEYAEGLNYLETLLLHEPNDTELRQRVEHLRQQASEVTKQEDSESPDASQAGWTSNQADDIEIITSETEAADELPVTRSIAHEEILVDDESSGVDGPVILVEPPQEESAAMDDLLEAEDDPQREAVSVTPDERIENDPSLDDSLANLDAEFERAIEDAGEDAELFQDEDALTGEFDINDLSPALETEDKPAEIDIDAMITRGLKHEKMEHLEQAESIYRELLEHHPDDFLVREHLERVLNLLSTETRQARKIRLLSNWLDKIKGVYHVS